MRDLLKIICVIFLCMGVSACYKLDPLPPTSAPEAKKKLEELLKDDYGIEEFTVRGVGNTIWIYLPFNKSFYKVQANNSGISRGDVTVKQEIKLLEGEFTNGMINIQYDIDKTRHYTKTQGYGQSYDEEFNKLYRYAQSAVKQAYPLQTEEDEMLPGDRTFLDPKKDRTHKDLVRANVDLEDYPEFFVIVFADIKHGLEMRVIFNLNDYHRATYDPGFIEEFARRSIQEQPFGDPKIVGDMTGEKHIDFRELTWPEFLLKQMKHRINFKYGSSAFPPTEDSNKEILEQVVTTLNAYDYDEFEGVQLTDLVTNINYNYSKSEVYTYTPEEKPQGKYHVIEFNYDEKDE